jgi:predicted alpha/beta superfamily hydrolase
VPPLKVFVFAFALAGLVISGRAQTDNAFTTNVLFTVTHVAGSSNVFVAGSVSSLGSWDVTRAPRLRNIGGDVWEVQVALPLGTNVEYRFFRRTATSGGFGSTNSTNFTWLGSGNFTNASPATPPGPYAGKTIFYHSGWTNVNILWRQPGSGADWVNTPMTRIGSGRSTNESLYRVTVGQAAWPLEFVPNNGSGGWDNAFGVGGSNYFTPSDFIFLQDGHVFNYWPPASISAPRFVTNIITSSYSGIPSRTVRALLPRGYTQNTNKRYPVLYMHDGQNDFDPGSALGSWSADATANREIQMGRMRETIIVAVDNTSNRFTEYAPPQDQSGTGDRYRDFLVNNVRPWVDVNHRTLNDPPNTGVMGSSLGGLISHYIGVSTNVFGLVAPMSPSYWYAPNWTASFNGAPKPAGRLFYLDWGTTESDGSMWFPAWNMVTNMIAKGFSYGDDFYYVVGVGQGHNEAAWASRLPGAFCYLFDIRRERNSLASSLLPPSLVLPSSTISNSARQVTLNFTTLGGLNYQIMKTGDLSSGTWTNVATFAPSTPWGPSSLVDVVPVSDPRQFYRMDAVSP